MKMREYEVLVSYEGDLYTEWVRQDAYSADDAIDRVAGWMGEGDYIIKKARRAK